MARQTRDEKASLRPFKVSWWLSVQEEGERVRSKLTMAEENKSADCAGRYVRTPALDV
jgi:hypothetical protein